MKFLHFCIDEKFNELIVQRFEEIKLGVHCFVVCHEKRSQSKFSNPNNKIKFYNQAKALELLSRYTYVIFHCATDIHMALASHLRPNHVSCLLSWGPNNDDLNELESHLIYSPITADFIEKRKQELKKPIDILYSIFSHLPLSIRDRYYLMRTGHHHPDYFRRSALSKFDFIGTVLEEEFKMLFSSKPYVSAQYIDFSYGNISELTMKIDTSQIKLGKNLMVGHSGFLYNNQPDVFIRLKKMGYKGKIIAPLSYPKSDWNLSLKLGKELFSENFISPEYLSKQEYLELISSCNSVILYNIIQQGLGTLYTALHLGMRVYLNDEGIVFKYCQEIGFEVFSFQKEFDLEMVSIPLLSDKKMKNRELLYKHISEETIVTKTKVFIRQLTHQKKEFSI